MDYRTPNYTPNGYEAKTRRRLIIDRLALAGIKTVGDLDAWRGQWTRYRALVYLVGEEAADLILTELDCKQNFTARK